MTEINQATNIYYDNKYFSQQKGIGLRSAERLKKRYQDLIKPTDIVLDFGCGGGFLLHGLICNKKIGFDLNPAALECAHSLGIDCVNDLSAVDLESIDVVISNSCLEHVKAPWQALSDISKTLKPGGKLILSVPHETISYAYENEDWNQHLYTWSPMAIGNLVKTAGFSVIEVRTYKEVQIPFINFFEKALGKRLSNLLNKPYRALRILISELGLKQLGVDGDCFLVAKKNC